MRKRQSKHHKHKHQKITHHKAIHHKKSASQSNSTSQSKATTPKTTTPKANTSSQPKTSEISAARAQQIALGQTGGGKVTQSHVDYENGRKVYDIKIINGNTEYDVEIGATDSKVYGFEKEVLRATTPTKPNTSKPSTNNNVSAYDDDDKYDDDRYDND
ncbi:PepSY domain-containing protein [Listeria riparia]|uniref:PepSY domain-containing protein n=1 Tax=Listeria riparia TaxID=1494964 RepID=UPI000689DCAA|nr:PepSY domain-containing protein [Listeria riparia]